MHRGVPEPRPQASLQASRHLPLDPPGSRPRPGVSGASASLPGASEGGAGLSRTCADTVRVPSRAAAFTRPWCHAAPAPARATPATAAARGPRLGTARRPAASPRLSLPPQAASQALLPAAAAIFAEGPERSPHPHLLLPENRVVLSRELIRLYHALRECC